MLQCPNTCQVEIKNKKPNQLEAGSHFHILVKTDGSESKQGDNEEEDDTEDQNSENSERINENDVEDPSFTDSYEGAGLTESEKKSLFSLSCEATLLDPKLKIDFEGKPNHRVYFVKCPHEC